MENIELIHDLTSTPLAEKSISRVHAAAMIGGLVFVGILSGYVVAKRFNHRDELAARAAQAAAGPFVQTAIARKGERRRTVKLLGETRPFASVTLYAKISGYLSDITVDKGDKVKKGQMLATISSPETTSQYEGAVANSKTKRATSERLRRLQQAKAATEEETDQAIAAAEMAEARMNELAAQKSYATILAPFDGTVTARFADPGALLQNATNGQSGALPIVTVSQTEKLRVTVFVDQRDAGDMKIGDSAEITVAERPDLKLEAKVSRKSGELDPRSRTMLTEIELDNSQGQVLTGSFVDVKIGVSAPDALQVPAEALVMRGTKSFLPVISKDGIAHYREVRLGENDGVKLTVLAGIDEGEMIALNVGNTLVEGHPVQLK